MNISFEDALTGLANDPTDLILWSVVLDSFSNKVSTTRTINGKSLALDVVLDLDSVDFANQGTTTTLLHGNASGNPSWGSIITNDITDANVTLTKVQNITNDRILGRLTSGSGTIEQLTGTQLTTLLDLFATNATTKGLVPGSNSVGTSYFLRADGTWAIPSGTGFEHDVLTHLSYAESGHTGFEPTITAGTITQYYRGDKTWQPLSAMSMAHNDTTAKDGGGAGYYGHLTTATAATVAIITNIGATTIPTGLTCSSTGVSTGSDGSQSAYVVLTWDAIATTTFDHYLIRYKKASYTYYTYLTSKTNTITIEGLTPNISYNFGVASVTKYGQESSYCTNISQTTSTDTTPPATVTSGTATTLILGVMVNWVANTESDLASYNIYRNTTNDSAGSSLVANIRGTCFIDNGLTVGQPYYYWIKAIDTSNNISVNYSTEVHATPHKVVNAETDIGHQGWVQTCTFSSTDVDTTAWGSGTFTSASGTAYSISAGNTGNMTVQTYIYLDSIGAPTVYQITTTATTAIGDGKVLVAIANKGVGVSATESSYILLNDTAYNINASNIVAGSITANEIAATTITASNIDTSTISSLSNLLITAPQVTIEGTTTFLSSWLSYKGTYDAGTSYKKGDEVLYTGNYWKYINSTPGSGHTPAENIYWTTGGASKITTIDGGNVTANTITTSQLNFTPFDSGTVIATINASAEGIKIDADNISISGSTTFSSGYDPTGRVLSIGGTYDSAASGARVRIFPDANTGLQIIDNVGSDVFKAIIGGTDVGDVIIGNYAGAQGIKYDKSLDTTTFLGSVIAKNSSISTVPVISGDLDGAVTNITPNHASTPDIYEITLASGSSGSCDIDIDGHSHSATWNTSLTQTAIDFTGSASYSGVVVSNPSGAVLHFTKAGGVIGSFYATNNGINGAPAAGSHIGTYSAAVAQVDKVTLSGTIGSCTLDCNGAAGVVEYSYATVSGTPLTESASDFNVREHTHFDSHNVHITTSANEITLTSLTPGTAFSPATVSTNIPRYGLGNIVMIGNEIFESTLNSDDGCIYINYRGYNGGTSKRRTLSIGDGMTNELIKIGGSVSSYITITIPDIGGTTHTGYLYYDAGTLKIS
jgi:hypothetical protein